MIWYNSKPKDSFEDVQSEKFISLLSSLDSFGIILSKKDHTLSLHLGALESEVNHITELAGITSSCDTVEPPALLTTMRLKNDYIHPLCVSPIVCKIYGQAAALSDFTLGVIGKRVDPRIVRRKAKSFLDRVSKGMIDMTKPIEWKLEQNSFFATSIFFSCIKDTIPFLSSINFTNKLSTPNALIARSPKRIKLNAPKLSFLGASKTPVLSPVEISSILSFPPAMFGLGMESGAEKTFSNLEGTIDDPADFFGD